MDIIENGGQPEVLVPMTISELNVINDILKDQNAPNDLKDRFRRARIRIHRPYERWLHEQGMV